MERGTTLIVFMLILSFLSVTTLISGTVSYAIFILLVFHFLMTSPQLKFPSHYAILFITILCVYLLNAVVSPYSPGPLYTSLGIFFTIIPFVVFYISYNLDFSWEYISKYIDSYIYLSLGIAAIIYVETIINDFSVTTSFSLLTTDWFILGYVASMFVQCIILSLIQLKSKGGTRYRFFVLFFFISVLLSNQLKAIGGASAVVLFYLLFLSELPKGLKALSLCMMGVAAMIVIPLLGTFNTKVDQYVNTYMDESNVEDLARPALYLQAVNMANDFLPLGTGQGTFGSIPANMYDSQVYYDYNLNAIYGLQYDGDVDFRNDAHWSSVLGEQGYLGSLLYIILIAYPVVRIFKKTNGDDESRNRIVRFLTLMCFLTIVIDSITLSVITRFAFVFVLSGISGMILRRLDEDCEDESDEDFEMVENMEDA